MKVLETRRLVLRHLEPGDLDALFALYRDTEVRRYFPEGTLTYEETRQELDWFLNGHPERPELGLWATLYKDTQEFIGRCGLLPWTLDGVPEVEVAYLIAKEFWGHGLGTEAAQGVLDHGFGALDLPRLISLIDRDNAASIRVATKIGMTFEREGLDEKGPFLLYSTGRRRAIPADEHDADMTSVRQIPAWRSPRRDRWTRLRERCLIICGRRIGKPRTRRFCVFSP